MWQMQCWDIMRASSEGAISTLLEKDWMGLCFLGKRIHVMQHE